MEEINCTFGTGGVADCKIKEGVIDLKKKEKNTEGVKPENTGEGEGRDQMQNYEEDVQLTTLIGEGVT